jgi:hypothetical protein
LHRRRIQHVVIMEIRVLFRGPLIEVLEAANEPLKRGWTARKSDEESITYSNTFETEDDFHAALDDLKSALAPRTVIEWGAVASESPPPD